MKSKKGLIESIFQSYAEHLVDIDRMEHSTGLGVGENLSWSAGSGTGDDQAVVAVNRWYNEIENYDFATGTSANGGVIGHFTQVTYS